MFAERPPCRVNKLRLFPSLSQRMWKYSWISRRVEAGCDDTGGENQEAVGGEDLLSISVSQGTAELFSCVRE